VVCHQPACTPRPSVASCESAMIVVHAAQGVNDAEVRAAMEEFLDRVEAVGGVSVASPYAKGGPAPVGTAAAERSRGRAARRRSVAHPSPCTPARRVCK
jgi:tRNA C32,U32 (ribose-2'-O)-methylase TrmJ